MKIRQSALRAIVIISIVVALVAAGYVVFGRSRQSGSIPRAAITPISPDAQAAVAGVSAFYTIDYSETAQQWADRVCTTTTADGCTFVRGFLANTVHTTAEQYSVQTSCGVLPVAMVDDDEEHMLRVWKMQVVLSNPWPGVEQSQTVYVAVEYDQVSQDWRMQHILFEQEAVKYEATP
jgi:hypothetical protein